MGADKENAGPVVSVHARVPPEMLAQLDAVVARLGRPGIPANRSEAIRHVLLRGFAALEADQKRGG